MLTCPSLQKSFFLGPNTVLPHYIYAKYHCEDKHPLLSPDPSLVPHPSTPFRFSRTSNKKWKTSFKDLLICSIFSVLPSHPQKIAKGSQCQQLFSECYRSQQAPLWLLCDISEPPSTHGRKHSHSQVILPPPPLPSDLAPTDPCERPGNSYSTAELATVTTDRCHLMAEKLWHNAAPAV